MRMARSIAPEVDGGITLLVRLKPDATDDTAEAMRAVHG